MFGIQKMTSGAHKNGSSLHSSVDCPTKKHWNVFQNEKRVGSGKPVFKATTRNVWGKACQTQNHRCRPFLLDCIEANVGNVFFFTLMKNTWGKMARSFGHRKAGNCDWLAEETLQKALGKNLFSKQTTGTEKNKEGNQRSHLSNGRREQMGRTANLFRVVDAWLSWCFRSNCFEVSKKISNKPPWQKEATVLDYIFEESSGCHFSL